MHRSKSVLSWPAARHSNSTRLQFLVGTRGLFLATDETRMKHGYDADKGRRQDQIRVSSVFHPWLKLFAIAARPRWLNDRLRMARWIACCLFTLLTCGLAAEASANETAAKPNVVFIFADDLGVNDLSCYGRKDQQTPRLDKLATQGMRFTSAYCAQPICSPSRAAVMTGKTPARLHLTTFLPGRADCPSQMLLHPKINMQLPLEHKTVAEYLKDAGYATACVGKWHLGGAGFSPKDQGFDVVHAGKANTPPRCHLPTHAVA